MSALDLILSYFPLEVIRNIFLYNYEKKNEDMEEEIFLKQYKTVEEETFLKQYKTVVDQLNDIQREKILKERITNSYNLVMKQLEKIVRHNIEDNSYIMWYTINKHYNKRYYIGRFHYDLYYKLQYDWKNDNDDLMEYFDYKDILDKGRRKYCHTREGYKTARYDMLVPPDYDEYK